MSFEHIKAGDIVSRVFGDVERPMKLRVTKVDDTRIHCAAIDANVGGWEFDRKTGVEEDEYLGWGVRFGVTGSYLISDTDARTSGEGSPEPASAPVAVRRSPAR